MNRGRTVVLGGAAAAGLVGAHVVDYVLAFRDPLHRAAILHATGHAYFGRAVAIAIGAAMVAIAGSAVLGFRGKRIALGWRAAAVRLCLIQVGAFALLEVGERIAVGAHVTDLVGVLGVAGIVLQIVVACVVAAILVGVGRAAHGLAEAVARSRIETTSPHAAPMPRAEVRTPRLVFASALAARAPPLAPR